MKVYEGKETCSGCSACKAVCPVEAIEMQGDSEGFLYPVVNDELCIDCNRCAKVCPFHSQPEVAGRLEKTEVFGFKHKDENVRLKSSSGGVYTAITDHVIMQRQGVCYGVRYLDDMTVGYSRAESLEERDAFTGSKYVQASVGSLFKQIEGDLKDKRLVLVTGTPCQIAGVAKYVALNGIAHDGVPESGELILMDMVCHGVPSPLLWSKYLEALENEMGSHVKEFVFRDKSRGWRGYHIRVGFEDGQVMLDTPLSKSFTNFYNTSKSIRPVCFNCPYANTERKSDIMIGDFWGVDKAHPDFYDPAGVSLVYGITDSGQGLLKSVMDEHDVIESSQSYSLQHNLKQPTAKPDGRDRFYNDLLNKDYAWMMKKHIPSRNKLVRKIKSILKG